jgi:hypothetical protein
LSRTSSWSFGNFFEGLDVGDGLEVAREAPVVTRLFAGIYMRRQKSILLGTLVLLRKSFRDLGAIVPKLRELGRPRGRDRRHARGRRRRACRPRRLRTPPLGAWGGASRRGRLSKSPRVLRRSHEGRVGAAKSANVGGAMSQYMLLVYEKEVDRAEQAERERALPMLVELHASLREAGLLVGVQSLRSTESATSVRVRDGETEITDGPFAVTKEVLAGYYVLECADLDEALKQAARLPMARWGTVEVRPVVPADEWLRVAREAGADVSDEAVEDLA